MKVKDTRGWLPVHGTGTRGSAALPQAILGFCCSRLRDESLLSAQLREPFPMVQSQHWARR